MYTSMKDQAKEIRSKIKSQLGLNARQVSVRVGSGYGAFYIQSKTVEADAVIDQIKEIGKSYESYTRCEVTQEILCGGNTFVFYRNSKEECI